MTGGLRDEQVYEEHGIFAYLYCEECGMRLDIDSFNEAIEHEIQCKSAKAKND